MNFFAFSELEPLSSAATPPSEQLASRAIFTKLLRDKLRPAFRIACICFSCDVGLRSMDFRWFWQKMKKRQQKSGSKCTLLTGRLSELVRPLVRAFLMVVSLCGPIDAANGDEIAFFYALDADFNSLKSESTVVGQTVRIGKYRVQRLELAGHHIFTAKMGSGTTETASSAAALLAKFQCSFAMSLGPAGSLGDAAPINSWWRIGTIVCYQKGTWTANGGFKSSDPVTLGSEATKKLDVQMKLPPLLREARVASVASGDAFIASTAFHEQLRTMADASLVDMNLAGLQVACNAFDVPLLAWKIVSDHADDKAGSDFRTFVANYRGDGGKAIASIIRSLPVQSDSPEAFPKLKELLEKPVDSSQH